MEVVTRPWGRYVVLYQDKDMWLKRLIILPGESLSLQAHQHREEMWRTTDVDVGFEIGLSHGTMRQDFNYYVPRTVKHRLFNGSENTVSVVEWAYGAPDERDIMRFQDKYGRV